MWSHIIGHKKQIEQLRSALASGRLHSAYLFAGPSGIGKRRVADALAAAALCEKAPAADFDACGTCPACVKLASGNHPDFFLLSPETSERGAVQHIRIDAVRELQSRLKFPPLEASRKIAVVDGADHMMEAAANALLKTLEEPTPSTHFMLITSYPQRLLATIRSRSCLMSFSPLPEEQLAARIAADKGISREEATTIARLSGGSMGLATALDPAFIAEVLARFTPLADRASSADIIETSQAWKDLGLDKTLLLFDLMASWYRDILRFKVSGRANELIHPEAAQKAGCFDIPRILRNLSSINGARLAAETSANKQLMFEQLLFSLASL
jgi:DNA polymerase-3 subunit delta'